MDSPLMTPEELARLLVLPKSGAWQLGREGELKFAVVRIGGRMRFVRAKVEKWLADGGSERTDAAPAGPR